MPVVREFSLRISPQELLDTSLGQLRILSAFLNDQLPAEDQRYESAALETRACEEIMRSLDELITRSTQLHVIAD